MRWANAWAASVGALLWSAAPAVLADEVAGQVTASVDPKTGETTISSAESKVSVRSARPDVRGTTVLKAGEQVKVEPGAAPPATPTRLDPKEISELGGCLVDFHFAAADRDSRASGERLTDRLVAFDVTNAGPLPDASPSDRPSEEASDRPNGSPLDEVGDPLTGQEGVCVATDCDSHSDPGYGQSR